MKNIIFVLALALVCSSVWATGGDMGAGTEPLTDGSEAYPWLIEDLADFDEFADPNYATTYWASGVHTKLMTDIDLAGRTYTTAVIAPDTDTDGLVSFQGIAFSSVFYGNDLTISNLMIENGHDYLGLFGKISSGAEINNLGIEDITITGDGNSYFVGSLVGDSDGIISNCYSTGSVTGYSRVGGLVGYNDYLKKINNCYSTNSVSGVLNTIGGFCGENYGSIYNSYATGPVLGNDNSHGIGGFCGENYGTISDCYAFGNVLAGGNSYDIGGFCGVNSSTSTIRNCYATGAISGGINSNNIGGLCGYNYYGAITECYSVGVVSGGIGSYNLADFCGYQSSSYSSITNSFWDSNTGTIGVGYILDSSSPGTVTDVVGKTTPEMMTQSTFTDWDFSDTDGDPADWMMLRELEDYPRLAGQEIYTGDIAGLYGVDLIDFSYLANYWGLDDCNGLDDCGRADIDNSGDIGLSDLVEVSNDWLQGI